MRNSNKLVALVAAAILALCSKLATEEPAPNVVAYLNLTLRPGLSLIANPLIQGDNTVQEILSKGPPPEEAILYKLVGDSFSENQWSGGGWSTPRKHSLLAKARFFSIQRRIFQGFCGLGKCEKKSKSSPRD
jgi:hypothetical protein